MPAAEQAKPSNPGTTLLSAYPELRPLQQASRGLGRNALSKLNTAAAEPPQNGVLELNLSQASSIELQSESGQRSQLNGAKGQLVWQLNTPLQLSITPAPTAGEVLWNGTPLPSTNQQPGRFRLPLAKA